VPSIRASATNTWPDCERRLIATTFPDLVRAWGCELARKPTHVGAHVGTAAHAGVAVLWRGVQAIGDWPSLGDADDAAVTSIRETIEDQGIVFDGTTTDANEAEIAARKIIRAYRGTEPPRVIPFHIEGALQARIGGDWILTGHVDLAERGSVFVAGSGLDDLKTGVQMPAPGPQLGSYDHLLEANGQPIDRVTMTFVRRCRRTADQPPPLRVPFDRGVIRRQARSILKEVVAKVDAFTAEQGGNDPFTFKANPSSRLCGAKYCPAFGTAWCPESGVKLHG
jgi:hypothetical protein